MQYTITIPGKPRGKGRPRFSRATGRTYTDDATAVYENLVKTIWMTVVGERLIGELSVSIAAHYAIPTSKPKKMQVAMRDGLVRPTTKPDIDNVIKAVLDGLNGVAYADDAQVVELSASKCYSDDPRVVVIVEDGRSAHERFCVEHERIEGDECKCGLNSVKMAQNGA